MFVYVLVETIFCRWEVLALLPSEATGMSMKQLDHPWLWQLPLTHGSSAKL